MNPVTLVAELRSKVAAVDVLDKAHTELSERLSEFDAGQHLVEAFRHLNSLRGELVDRIITLLTEAESLGLLEEFEKYAERFQIRRRDE